MREWCEIYGKGPSGAFARDKVSAVIENEGGNGCVVVCDGQRYAWHAINYNDALRMVGWLRDSPEVKP